jgi:hypothetical protein
MWNQPAFWLMSLPLLAAAIYGRLLAGRAPRRWRGRCWPAAGALAALARLSLAAGAIWALFGRSFSSDARPATAFCLALP